MSTQTRGTRDYGMFDVNFESNLVRTLRRVVVIARPVVACSPAAVVRLLCSQPDPEIPDLKILIRTRNVV